MSITVSPTQSNVFQALGNFIAAVTGLPATSIVQGQANRVAPPNVTDYVVMTPILMRRIETNTDSYGDVSFSASIVGTLMTVTTVKIGTIQVGATVFGSGVQIGTFIQALGTGTGGPGTYIVSPSQNAPQAPMAAGGATVLQPVEMVVQVDVHGPSSQDNSKIISTLFRDQYGVDQFATSGFDIVPLYADDPKQIPFINENDQFENRWIVEAHMQCNELTGGIPQQYFDAVNVNTISVTEAYPP